MPVLRTKGFSLIELLITAAILALFFGGLFTTIQTSLRLVTESRARLSALSVANDQLEYIRSLSYDAVGTVSGIPNGAIPQVSTTTLNGYAFTVRTLIEFVDDPADGVGPSDTNSITTDYKRVKVEISWVLQGVGKNVILTTTVVPRSIETNVGGGTIRVNVTDANVLAVSGAMVRLLNTTGTSTIDVTKYTDSSGSVLFGGAPAGSGYQIFVSRPGYSSEQTYVATTSNPNPVLQPISLLAADISTVNVQIDTLSSVLVRLLSSRTEASSTSQFASTTELAALNNIVVTSGNLVLTSTAGVYQSSGTAMLMPLTPSPFVRWQSLVIKETVVPQTSRLIRFYTSTSTSSLIPDSDLPGNSAGFAATSIDLSRLDPSVYPTLVVGISFNTTNTAVTPSVDDLTLYYTSAETPLSNSFTWRGNKVIGAQLDFSPIYKVQFSTTTNSSGERQLSSVEWDTYQVTIPGYDIQDACADHPIAIAPNTVTVLTLVTTPDTAHSLRVAVTADGVPVRDASISLVRSGTTTRVSSGCGQAFFGGLTSASDYQVSVTANGYPTTTINPVSVSGDTVVEVAL